MVQKPNKLSLVSKIKKMLKKQLVNHKQMKNYLNYIWIINVNWLNIRINNKDNKDRIIIRWIRIINKIWCKWCNRCLVTQCSSNKWWWWCQWWTKVWWWIIDQDKWEICQTWCKWEEDNKWDHKCQIWIIWIWVWWTSDHKITCICNNNKYNNNHNQLFHNNQNSHHKHSKLT